MKICVVILILLALFDSCLSLYSDEVKRVEELQELIVVDEFWPVSSEDRRIEAWRSNRFLTQDFLDLIVESFSEGDTHLFSCTMFSLWRREEVESDYLAAFEELLEKSFSENLVIKRGVFERNVPNSDIELVGFSADFIGFWILTVLRQHPGLRSKELAQQALFSGGPRAAGAAVRALSMYNPEDLDKILQTFVEQVMNTPDGELIYFDALEYVNAAVSGTLNQYSDQFF